MICMSLGLFFQQYEGSHFMEMMDTAWNTHMDLCSTTILKKLMLPLKKVECYFQCLTSLFFQYVEICLTHPMPTDQWKQYYENYHLIKCHLQIQCTLVKNQILFLTDIYKNVS